MKYWLLLFLTLLSSSAMAVGRLQNEDSKSYADIKTAVLSTTGSLVNGNACISALGATTNVSAGQFVYDATNPTYITLGTTVFAVPGICSAGQIQMSANANHNATSDTITFGGQLSQLLNMTKLYDTVDSLEMDTALNTGYFGAHNLDGVFQVGNTSDATKLLKLSLSGMTAGRTLTLASSQSTSQTLTFPNISGSDTLAALATTQAFTNKTISDALTFNEISTPASPSSGFVKLYSKSDNNLYFLNSASVESKLATAVTTAVGGGGTLAKSGSYGLQSTDNGKVILVHSNVAAVQLTFPAPAANLMYTVKDADGNANKNPISMLQNASENIEGVAATYTISAPWYSGTFMSDGLNWYIIAH